MATSPACAPVLSTLSEQVPAWRKSQWRGDAGHSKTQRRMAQCHISHGLPRCFCASRSECVFPKALHILFTSGILVAIISSVASG